MIQIYVIESMGYNLVWSIKNSIEEFSFMGKKFEISDSKKSRVLERESSN